MVDVKDTLAKIMVLFDELPDDSKEDFNIMIQKTDNLKHLSDNVNAWYLSHTKGDI